MSLKPVVCVIDPGALLIHAEDYDTVLPGAVFIIGSWYRQFETASRTTLFYMSSSVAAAFGPILAYALSLIKVGHGDFSRGWRWIFLIEGIITILTGVAAIFTLVDFPEHAKWLTPRQKHIATARLTPDKQAKKYIHPTVMEGLKMLLDWNLLFFSLQYFVGASSSYFLAFFTPIILREGMGFSYALSLVLLSPPYVITIISSFILAWISDKHRTRWPIMTGQSLCAITGLIIVLYGRRPGVRYFGLYPAVFGISSNIAATLSYGQSNIPDIRRRGVAAAAMITFALQEESVEARSLDRKMPLRTSPACGPQSVCK